ncbi:MAG: hypothetical protein KJ939_03590 [Nanoarchaeota archaeon]|nr:hypothetical protein [Nanoarchaeota archaeon]
MRLDINLWIKEYFKTRNLTLHFSLANEETLELTPGALHEASKCFNSNWTGLEPGLENGKDINELYKPCGERLSQFFKFLSKEKTAPIHYYLLSNSFKEVHGVCVAGTHYKSTFTRNLTAEELRNIGLEVKKALEGL